MGTSSNKSTTSRTVYGNTTSSNPYAFSKTDNSGTLSGFKEGTALQSVYDFVNNNINSLLGEYLQPNLDSVTNKANIQSFANNLAAQSKANLENSIINPLSNRNMVRSSQATDLYRNLLSQNVSEVSNHMNELLSNSQENTAKMISNLLSYYMLGANYLTDMQNHSLKASSGNATKISDTNGGGSQGLMNDIVPMAIAAIIAGCI